jgi:hypothetical protein
MATRAKASSRKGARKKAAKTREEEADTNAAIQAETARVEGLLLHLWPKESASLKPDFLVPAVRGKLVQLLRRMADEGSAFDFLLRGLELVQLVRDDLGKLEHVAAPIEMQQRLLDAQSAFRASIDAGIERLREACSALAGARLGRIAPLPGAEGRSSLEVLEDLSEWAEDCGERLEDRAPRVTIELFRAMHGLLTLDEGKAAKRVPSIEPRPKSEEQAALAAAHSPVEAVDATRAAIIEDSSPTSAPPTLERSSEHEAAIPHRCEIKEDGSSYQIGEATPIEVRSRALQKVLAALIQANGAELSSRDLAGEAGLPSKNARISALFEIGRAKRKHELLDSIVRKRSSQGTRSECLWSIPRCEGLEIKAT